jgi:hypothetical protein
LTSCIRTCAFLQRAVAKACNLAAENGARLVKNCRLKFEAVIGRL